MSVALVACDRPAGESPVAAPVAVQAAAPPAAAPAAAPTPTPAAIARTDGDVLNDDSLGVVCERGDAEPLQLRPEGQGKFRLAYQDDAKAPVTVDVRCNPITSSQVSRLKFDCTDRADPGKQVLKITTETRQNEDEIGNPYHFIVHLHDIVQADGRTVHSEGNCNAYKFNKDGSRQIRRHALELSCEGTIAGKCKVKTDLVFALESFPVIDDSTARKMIFDASARASLQIFDESGKTVLADLRLDAAEMDASASMDFTYEPGGEPQFAPQGGDYRASSPTFHHEGEVRRSYSLIHFNNEHSSLYVQPGADAPSLRRCPLVGSGDLQHYVEDLQCTKKLTPQ